MLLSKNIRLPEEAVQIPVLDGKTFRTSRDNSQMVVGVTGIGPVTSSLSGTRSNQLSYTPGVITGIGGGNRDRTGDPVLAKHVLYRLSYAPDRLLLAAMRTV